MMVVRTGFFLAPLSPIGQRAERDTNSSGDASVEDVALFLDVDGTLLDIARTPDSVVIPDGLAATLRDVERRLKGALALVSGRTIAQLDALFAPLRLRASGVHGAETRLDPDDSSPTSGVDPLPTELWLALKALLREFPGTIAENKRFSFTVHYRQTPESAITLLAAINKLIATPAWNGTKLLPAHYAFELKAPAFDKGKAIAMFMTHAPFRGRTPIFVGDDVTDEAGFAAVTSLTGVAYSVGQPREGAIAAFSEPRDVREWLSAFVKPEVVA